MKILLYSEKVFDGDIEKYITSIKNYLINFGFDENEIVCMFPNVIDNVVFDDNIRTKEEMLSEYAIIFVIGNTFYDVMFRDADHPETDGVIHVSLEDDKAFFEDFASEEKSTKKIVLDYLSEYRKEIDDRLPYENARAVGKVINLINQRS